MADFARTLEFDVDRPVIDMTGLAASYDIRLEFASAVPIADSFAPSSPDPQAAELFTDEGTYATAVLQSKSCTPLRLRKTPSVLPISMR